MTSNVRVGGLAAGILLALSCLMAWPMPAEAHRDGCHRWHSCPSDTGSYVCGDTGHFAECGYSSLPGEPVPLVEPVRDDKAPRRPVVSKPAIRPDGHIAVTVAAERGAKLVIKSGGKTLFKTTASGGTQALTFRGVDGLHRYSVRATDSSGNASSVAKFSATADAVAPSLSGAVITIGTPENALTELVFGPGEAVKYVVTVDGDRVASGRASGDDKQVGVPVGNGRHRLVLKLTDAAGNTSVLKQSLKVNVPRLAPVLELLTEPNESTQRFSIVGTPGSRGTLTIADKIWPVDLHDGAAELSVDLPDGSYPAGTFSISDQVGRKGSTAVPALTIDTLAPSLKVMRVEEGSTTGRLVARVTAEQGTQVVWRVLDGNSKVIERGKYRATALPHVVDVDADEGRATLAVTASDEADNSATDRFTADIGADPLTVTDWLAFLVFVGLLGGGGLLGWRRRDAVKRWWARSQHRREVRKARAAHNAALQRHAVDLQHHANAVADHERRLGSWTARRRRLVDLRDEAQSANGAGWSEAEILSTKAKAGERVFSIVRGRLLEERSRDSRPTLVEVEPGQVAITNLRVLFLGPSKRREWAYDKVESLDEVGDDVTLIRVSNRKSLSGVGYDEPERTRVHLALAMAPGAAGRQQVVDTVSRLLHGHDGSRPGAPAAAPSPPRPPAILVQEAAEAAALAH